MRCVECKRSFEWGRPVARECPGPCRTAWCPECDPRILPHCQHGRVLCGACALMGRHCEACIMDAEDEFCREGAL